jgi:hypothetical protein
MTRWSPVLAGDRRRSTRFHTPFKEILMSTHRSCALAVVRACPRTVPGAAAVLAVALASGCSVEAGGDPDPATEAQATQAATSSFVQAVQGAESSFQTTVEHTVSANAAEIGFSIPATEVSVADLPGARTLATALSPRATSLVFVSQWISLATGRLEPGLYEIDQDGRNAILYFHDPVAGKLDLRLVAPDPHPPVPFRTPLGDYMCAKAPAIIMEFCQSFVACAGYEIVCPPGWPPE